VQQRLVKFLASPHEMLFGNLLKAIISEIDRMIDCLPAVSCNRLQQNSICLWRQTVTVLRSAVILQHSPAMFG